MLMMSFISLGIVTILWVLYGFSLAFGTDNGGFIGGTRLRSACGNIGDRRAVARHRHPDLRLRRLPADVRDHHPGADQRRDRRPGEVRRLGAVRRRCGPRSSTSRSRTGCWGAGGWLVDSSASIDFAGGTAVHINAGAAALGAGPRPRQARRLQAGPDAPAQPAAGHARRRPAVVRLVRLQRRLRARRADGVAALAFINTQVATAAAMLGWLVVEQIRDGHSTTLGAASGAVAGLVAITPACGSSRPLGAIAVGAHRRCASAPAPSA